MAKANMLNLLTLAFSLKYFTSINVQRSCPLFRPGSQCTLHATMFILCVGQMDTFVSILHNPSLGARFADQEKLRNAVCCFLRNCLVATIIIPKDSLVQQQQHARHGGVPLRVHVQHGDGHGLRHPELLLAAQKHREPDNC